MPPTAPAPATLRVNGVRIAHEQTGTAGPPVVLVHGSWGSHASWDPVVPRLARRHRVITYDRRGHGDSERPPGQGHFAEDVADLAGIVERLGPAPAWVAGNSAGAVIALKLAAARPDLLRGVIAHEPPLSSLLDDDMRASMGDADDGPLAEVRRLLARGDFAAGAELFVDEVALGPGSWQRLPDAMRRTMVRNAPTYLDELADPSWREIDQPGLARFAGPVLLTSGGHSPPFYTSILDRLAELLTAVRRHVFRDAGHIPYATHPDDWARTFLSFVGPRGAAT